MTTPKISAQTEKPSFSVGDGNTTHINLCNVATLLGSYRYVPYDYEKAASTQRKSETLKAFASSNPCPVPDGKHGH